MIFHKRTMRGDYAALLHSGAVLCLHIFFRISAAPSAWRATGILSATYLLTLVSITTIYRLSPWHPLYAYPGPILAKLTSLWLLYISLTGKRYLILDDLHARYGPYLRIG